MTALAALWIPPVVAPLVWIARVDARSAVIDPRAVAALAAVAVLWHAVGAGPAVVAATPPALALAALLGAAAVAVPRAVARRLGRRPPIGPGDALLLAATGLLLGPLGLGWTMVVGSAAALAHRGCIQRRRGRPFAQGHLPAGTGLAAGAACVFLAMHAAPAAAGAAGGSAIAAVEIAPVSHPIPETVAAREVAVSTSVPLAFPALAGRIAAAAGLDTEIEERPSRVAGGAASLPPPPAVALDHEGPLGELVRTVSARTGYAAEWRDDRLVWYRHWDREQALPPAPAPAPAAVAAAVPAADGSRSYGSFAEWMRDLGGTLRESPAGQPGSAAAPPEGPEAREPEGEAGAAPPPGSAAPAPPEPPPPPPEPSPEPPPEPWRVSPAAHGTLRGVLDDWAGRAGWTVVWRMTRAHSVGAAAEFPADLGFLDAVDRLLSDPAVRRLVAVTAHVPNRHLVVADAGGGP